MWGEDPDPTTLETRPGYWHFEKVHRVVLARQYDCAKCHAELGATYEPAHAPRRSRPADPRVPVCHLGEDR